MGKIRILIAGDTHGELNWSKRLVKYAAEHRIKTILQVGDFGYWPHRNAGQTFLVELSKACVARNIHWYWIDGNHENHDWLDAEGAFGADEFKETYPNLFYVPRGHRWVWSGISFLGLGGAVSIDRQYRVPGDSWWAREAITMADADKACAGGKADVMITHDAPDGVNFPIEMISHSASQAHRELLRQVVNEVNPRLLIHGHYHERFTSMVGNTATEGISRDGTGAKGFAILNLPSLSVTHPRDW